MNIKFRKKIYIIIVSFIVIFIIVISGCILYKLNTTKIYDGITINGVDVGGLDRDEAIKLLNDKLSKQIRSRKLQLQYNNYRYFIKYDELGVSYDYYKTIQKAYNLGKQGNIFKRLYKIYFLETQGYNFNMKYIYNKEKIYLLVTKIESELFKERRNAQIKYLDGKFNIKKEVIGRKVDKVKLQERIICTLEHKKEIVYIPAEKSVPLITEQKLKSIKYKIGSYTTYFNTNNTNRVNNIRVSSNSLKGKVILANEIFSFNNVVGPRDKDCGYKKANVVIDGKLVPAFGGGVCQVSTTLYNAVLMSNLEVIERHNHSLPSTYVGIGRDATVSYDYLDLKFRNNTNGAVFIHSQVHNNSLLIELFGSKKNKYKIEVKSEVVDILEPKVKYINDNSIGAGEEIIEQEGKKGYKVNTYKIYITDDKIINKKLISEDIYKSKDKIIKKGTKITENEVYDNENNDNLN